MGLFLFDIDMTLLDSAGAGREAMELTFNELYGIEHALDHMHFAGLTDTYIVGRALEHHGCGDVDLESDLPRFIEAYVRHLSLVLPSRPAHVLPGVSELVTALAAVPGIRLGVATGNFRAAAQLKLTYFGLSLHLREGGFGEDSADRSEVVARAVERLRATDTGRADSGSDGAVVVVGDTQHDVRAARDNGYRSAGVATGFSSRDELAEAGADIVFDDFSDRESVFLALLALAGHTSD